MHPSGDFVVLDSGNHRVLRCPGGGSGLCSTVAGGNGRGSANNQLADYASGLTVAPNGDYVIADYHNNRIQRCPADGSGTCTRVAGSDIQGSSNTDLWNPIEVLVYRDTEYIVADYVNRRIQHCPAGNQLCTTLDGDGGSISSPRSILWVDSTTTTTMTSTLTSRTVSVTTSATQTSYTTTKTSATSSSTTTHSNTSTSITTNTTTSWTFTITSSTATSYTTSRTSATSTSATFTSSTYTTVTTTRTSATTSSSTTYTATTTSSTSSSSSTTTYSTTNSRSETSTATTVSVTRTESHTITRTISTTKTSTSTNTTTMTATTTTTRTMTSSSSVSNTGTTTSETGTTSSSTTFSSTTSSSTTRSSSTTWSTTTSSFTNTSTTSTSFTITTTTSISNTSTSTTHTITTTTIFRSAHRTNATLEILNALIAAGPNADVDIAQTVEDLLLSMANYEDSVTPAVLTALLEVISVNMLGVNRTDPISRVAKTLNQVLIVANSSTRFLFTPESLANAAGILKEMASSDEMVEGPLDPEMLENVASSMSILVGAAYTSRSKSAQVSDVAQVVVDAIVDSAARNVSIDGSVIVRSPGLELKVAKPSAALWAAGQSSDAFRLPPLEQTAGSQWTLNHVRWDYSPFAFAGAAPFDMKLTGPAVVQQLSVREKRHEVAISGLVTPVQFCLARDLPINLPTDEQRERGCFFWNVTEKRWSTSGCSATPENVTANATHICCTCNHLTAFTAGTKEALCKFCKVTEIDLDPGDWYKFKFEEPGVWILVGMMVLLYLPCTYLMYRDSWEQKSIEDNQGTYFKESWAESTAFECMILPPSRLCMGCLKCAPVVLSCPPVCCRRRSEGDGDSKEEGTLTGILGELSDKQDAVALTAAGSLRQLRGQAAASEKEIEKFSQLPLESQLQMIKAVEILWKSRKQSNWLASTTEAQVMHPFLHSLERHVLRASLAESPRIRRRARAAQEAEEGGEEYAVGLFEILDNPFKVIAHKVQEDELGVIASLKDGIKTVGARLETARGARGVVPSFDHAHYEKCVTRIQAWLRAWLARRVSLPIAQGRMLQVVLRPTFGDPCDQSLRALGAKRVVLRVPDGREPSGGEVAMEFPEIVVTFAWEFIPQACTNMPQDRLFGQLNLSSVAAQCRVTEVAFGEEFAGQRVALALEVKTGIRTQENWELPVQELDPTSDVNSVTWAGARRWFNIWYFCSSPLVRVEVAGKGSGQPEEIAFMYLPSEEKLSRERAVAIMMTEETMTQTPRPVDPDRIIFESLQPSNLVPLAGEVEGWSHHWTLSAGDGSQHRSEGKVELEYKWKIRDHVGTLTILRAAWKATRGSTKRKLRILIQRALPTQNEEMLIVREAPSSGHVNSTDLVDFGPHSLRHYRDLHFKDEGTAIVSQAEVSEIIQRVQYLTWSTCRIMGATVMRETPFNACCGYSAIISRKQRFAVLSSAVVLAAFFSVLLFDVDCRQEPKPVACKPKTIQEQFLSWYAVIASVWGVLLSIPIPLLLRLLFKKRVIMRQMSEERKGLTIRLWRYNEMFAWFLVVLIHLGSWCTLAAFVRLYNWNIVEQWVSSAVWSIIIRFIAVPSVCTVGTVLLLLVSRASRCLDCLVGATPHITTFQDSVQGMMQQEEELSDTTFDSVAG
eukprot:TRINITY_DN7387_c0_g2_i1.p1 TRINITY_DN7387_c0_g2~~TRINITY_DN7387_c0_g2_i1.p1  ORF type:complete len:1823 (-),score=241.56 TRINITY_DN7387_c0_g2_i1:206-5125(-)